MVPLARLTARRTSSQTRHLGRQTGFVDEDQLHRVEIELAVEPGAATLQDVGAILLQCVCGLYKSSRCYETTRSRCCG
jgi:hypothetical protein